MIFLNASVFICLQVVVAAMTIIFVETYEIKRDVIFSNADATFRKSRPRNFFLDQPLVDKIVDLQTSSVIPVRDRNVNQRGLRNVSSKDRLIYSSGFSMFRYKPIKQNPFMASSFKDKPLFKDAILKNQKMRGERTVLRDNPFEEQSLTPEEIFEGPPSTYRSRTPFRGQLFSPVKNLFHEQLSSAEQTSFEEQATFVEPPGVSNSINFYQNDYIKPIDSYEYKDMTLFDGKSTNYGKFTDVTQF